MFGLEYSMMLCFAKFSVVSTTCQLESRDLGCLSQFDLPMLYDVKDTGTHPSLPRELTFDAVQVYYANLGVFR
jgi:hypothetical protein